MFGRKKEKTREEKLELWKSRYQHNKTQYSAEREKMDRRERLYRGEKEILPAQVGGTAKEACHVRNIAAELVESQVSSTIPQPKVTALRPQDEHLARLIEDMLRNELDRLPMEYNNDAEERTVPIQGGAYGLVEWNPERSTHHTRGALEVTYIHPKAVTPQDGVISDLEDMDYWFLELPRTKEYIRRRYGVTVEDEGEDRPEARGLDETAPAEDMVTQILAYYRNDEGGIGLFTWVGEQILEELEDCQARQIWRCKKCGQQGDGESCDFCGATAFAKERGDCETLLEDVQRSDGSVIPAWSPVMDEWGQPMQEIVLDDYGNAVMETLKDDFGVPLSDGLGGYQITPMLRAVTEQTKIPYYKPNVYPLVLRKNVSLYGRLLGDSDMDKISDQQEATKKIETKLIEKLCKGGSVVTLPNTLKLDTTDEEMRIVRVKSVDQIGMIKVLNLQADISGDITLLNQVYEEARQVIGITDSFQGRQDTTATSGVAKEFSAKQAAGRLESKKTMKEAYYARLFEVMFKFILAYADEPRQVVATDNQGHTKYETFNRYDFLEQDETGEWYWNDRFLFSVDASASLAHNREALWQECRMNFQQGCFGDPSQMETLVVFWTRMETLHYPGASDTKTYLEGKLKEQQAQAAQQAQLMQMQIQPKTQEQPQTQVQAQAQVQGQGLSGISGGVV